MPHVTVEWREREREREREAGREKKTDTEGEMLTIKQMMNETQMVARNTWTILLSMPMTIKVARRKWERK